MPRTRKQSANVVAEVKAPETSQVLITREQYIQDFKVRWEIHTYEVNKLGEDLKKGFELLKQMTNMIADKVYFNAINK